MTETEPETPKLHKAGCPLAGVEEEFSSCACFPPTPAPIESTLADELVKELENRHLIRGQYYILMPHLRDRILAALRTPPQSGEVSQEQVEAGAQAIFEHYEFGSWQHGEKPAWVPGGNSEMQNVARAFARAALNSPPPPSVEVGLADEPVAWLHTLHMEGGQTYTRLLDHNGRDEDEPECTAFGLPGRDYSGEYTVTSEPLFLRQQPIGVVEDGVEQAFREGFTLGDFAGGGQADPRTVDLAWQNSRARAALSSPTDTKGDNCG
jgi:hypothetical protein